MDVIVGELLSVKERFGDRRRTEIVAETGEIRLEDLIANEEVLVTVSHAGYIKRNDLGLYRSQGRGGKGVISTVAVALVLCWQAALAFGAVWLALFFARGYVSLASIAAAFALPAAAALARAPAPVTVLFALLALFVLARHRANVRRLLAGTESRMRGG